MKITANSLDDLSVVAHRILEEYPNKVIAFYGQMGVGKTTFIKVMCSILGVNPSEMSSPTQAIVNQYEAREGSCVYHFDFYRVNHEHEAYDLGYEEYFYSDAYCFIEWPTKIETLLPEGLLKIHIETDLNKRIFTIEESNS